MSLNTFSFLITPQEKKQILKSNLVKYLPIKNNYIEYLLEYKKTKITIYKTQKCLIQGNETKQVIETFFDSHLPNLALMNPKIQQTNIIGSDEVGVGDYFGGLCVCAVFLDDKLVAKINDLNIKDSKLLDDTTICDLAIKLIAIVPYEIYNILPIEYNHLIELYHNSHVIKTIGEHKKCVGSQKWLLFKCKLFQKEFKMKKWSKEACAKFVHNVEKNYSCFVELKQYRDMINAFKIHDMQYDDKNEYIDVTLIDLDQQLLKFALPVYKYSSSAKLYNTFDNLRGVRKSAKWKLEMQQMIINSSKKGG